MGKLSTGQQQTWDSFKYPAEIALVNAGLLNYFATRTPVIEDHSQMASSIHRQWPDLDLAEIKCHVDRANKKYCVEIKHNDKTYNLKYDYG